jgi:6-phosphogluconate dehydrogenase
MLSAMRFGFGGHVEGQESIDPEPKPRKSQDHSTGSGSAGMPIAQLKTGNA